jgi:exopolysaccharide production protein ExoY
VLAIESKAIPAAGYHRIAIRTIDVVLSAVMLAVLSPLFLVIYVAVRVFDPGPALFRQGRIGKGGKYFKVAKFRTMHVGAEAALHGDEALWAPYVANGFKLPQGEDPRISHLGRFLRSSSLDELPQLWNVLRGQMSLVGPRPLLACQIDLFVSRGVVEKYYSVRPGITGLWQVSGRSNLSNDERVELDTSYADGQTLRDYLSVLLRTPRAVLRREGAY